MPFDKIDPLVENLTTEQIKDDIEEYESLLDSNADEYKLQSFLEKHSYFFNGIIRLFGASPLYSKIKLGDQFEVDFACFDAGSVGPEWRLIEIESAKHKMFTKAGELTAQAHHAIQQVRDWQLWIDENISFAQKLMPMIIYPRGYIFIGRREEHDEKTRRRLLKLNKDVEKFIEIHSLDYFASMARSVLNLVEGKEGGGWPLPMNTLTHKELRKGLPEKSEEYLEIFKSSFKNVYPDEFMRSREGEKMRMEHEENQET